jgi:hypothetical protein
MSTTGGALVMAAGGGSVAYVSVGDAFTACPPLDFAVRPGQIAIIQYLTTNDWIEGTGWVETVSGADPQYHFDVYYHSIGWLTGNGTYRLAFQALAMMVIVCALGSLDDQYQ